MPSYAIIAKSHSAITCNQTALIDSYSEIGRDQNIIFDIFYFTYSAYQIMSFNQLYNTKLYHFIQKLFLFILTRLYSKHNL